MKGKWTVPGTPFLSSHLVSRSTGDWSYTRCGLDFHGVVVVTDDVPAAGKTCETCLRLSRRDS